MHPHIHPYLHPGNCLVVALRVLGQYKGNPPYLFVLFLDHIWIKPLPLQFLSMMVLNKWEGQRERERDRYKEGLIDWTIYPIRVSSLCISLSELNTALNPLPQTQRAIQWAYQKYTYHAQAALEMHRASSELNWPNTLFTTVDLQHMNQNVKRIPVHKRTLICLFFSTMWKTINDEFKEFGDFKWKSP